MKIIITILTICITNQVLSQFTLSRTNLDPTTDSTWELYISNTPGNGYPNSKRALKVRDTSFFRIYCLNYRTLSGPNNYVAADDSGNLKKYPVSNLSTGLQSSFDTRYLQITDTTGKWLSSGYIPSWISITGKPSFATVATSGSYSDLTGRPSLATVATSGLYSDLSGSPNLTTSARSAVSAGSGLTYNSSTGIFTNGAPDQTVAYTYINGHETLKR